MKLRESGMPHEEMWNNFFKAENILKELELQKSFDDVAEFGSGYGTFTIPAAQMVKEKTLAFDIEDEMINSVSRKIEKLNIENVELIKRDFSKDGSGLADRSVGYVMLFNILHCEDPFNLLNEAKRILKPEGMLGIIHWNYDSSTPRGPSMEIRPKPEQILEWVKESGFKILKPDIDLPPYHYGILCEK